jgi:hypothetical protein
MPKLVAHMGKLWKTGSAGIPRIYSGSGFLTGCISRTARPIFFGKQKWHIYGKSGTFFLLRSFQMDHFEKSYTHHKLSRKN